VVVYKQTIPYAQTSSGCLAAIAAGYDGLQTSVHRILPDMSDVTHDIFVGCVHVITTPRHRRISCIRY